MNATLIAFLLVAAVESVSNQLWMCSEHSLVKDRGDFINLAADQSKCCFDDFCVFCRECVAISNGLSGNDHGHWSFRASGEFVFYGFNLTN